MWLLNKISCEIQILNEKVGKLMIENGELEEEIKKLKSDLSLVIKERDDNIKQNKKLKESLDIATKCSCKEEDGIIRLSEENRKLKEELERYKKQYKHSMGDYIDEDLYDLDC